MAVFPLAFMFSGAATLSWTAQADCAFVGARSVLSTSGLQVITTNPTQTPTETATPTSTRIQDDVLWANSNVGQAFNVPVKIPISAGSQLLVKSSAATSVIAYFDDLS